MSLFSYLLMSGALFYVPLAAIAVLAGRRRREREAWACVLFAAAVLLVAYLPTTLRLLNLSFQAIPHWLLLDTAVVLQIALLALATLVIPGAVPVGLTRPDLRNGRVLWIAGAVVAFQVAWLALAGPYRSFEPTTLLRILVLQPIATELLFRGVLYSASRAACGPGPRVFGVEFGWAALPVIGFSAVAYAFPLSGDVAKDPWLAVQMIPTLVVVLTISLGLYVLRERSGSIWPGVVVAALFEICRVVVPRAVDGVWS